MTLWPMRKLNPYLLAAIFAAGCSSSSNPEKNAQPHMPAEVASPPPPAFQTKTLKASSSPATAGQTFISAQLAELDSFKSNPNFHKFGFGRGGPYYRWLSTMNDKKESSSFSTFERVAVGDLQTLGLEYSRTNGRENEYTQFARSQIVAVVQHAN